MQVCETAFEWPKAVLTASQIVWDKDTRAGGWAPVAPHSEITIDCSWVGQGGGSGQQWGGGVQCRGPGCRTCVTPLRYTNFFLTNFFLQ